jgi:hypothetical protein
MIGSSGSEGPKYPFAIMNRHYIMVAENKSIVCSVGERAFSKGFFKEDAVVIDVNCRKFPILDVISLGRTWSIWNYFAHLWNKDPELSVRYVFGEPVQLTFDEARQEIVELICSRRWYGQTGGTETGWRGSRANISNMREFLIGEYGVGFYGRWVWHLPLIKRKKRKPKEGKAD